MSQTKITIEEQATDKQVLLDTPTAHYERASQTTLDVFGTEEKPDVVRKRSYFVRTLGDISARLQSVFAREKEVTDPVIRQNLALEKEKILREKVRTIRLSELQMKWNPDTQEILKLRENFDSVKASDMLFLRQKGVDISSVLLTKEGDPLARVDKSTLVAGDKLVVNFGENKSLRSSLGLANILPAEVLNVRINGVEGVRRNSPRPGYYSQKPNGKPLYLPVYNGDKVEILKTGTLSTEDKTLSIEADHLRFRQERIRDMVRAIQEDKDNWKSRFSTLSEDTELMDEAVLEKENEEKRKSYQERTYGKINSREGFLAYFADSVNDVTKTFGIPPTILLKLFEKESGFSTTAMNPSGAYGLGQIKPETLSELNNKIIPAQGLISGPLTADDPVDQIKAACAYLKFSRDEGKKYFGREISWADSFLLYHGGPNVANWNIQKYLDANSGIKVLFTGELTAENYMKAASKYYELDGLQTAIWEALPPSTRSLAWDKFEGYPMEKSNDGMTYCSRTAALNASVFGISVPRAESAKKSREQYGSEAFFADANQLPANANVADVFLSSTTKNGSIHGHRALALKAKHDGEWYILDPYYTSQSNPISLKEYQSIYSSRNGGKIEAFYPYKAHGYASKLLSA